MSNKESTSRWQPRATFTVRALLLLAFAISIAFGWMCHEARKQANAIAALARLGCSFEFVYGRRPTIIESVRLLLHEEDWRSVIRVDAMDTSLADTDMNKILALPELTDLFLSGTQVTDDGLRCISSVPRLENLQLNRTSITDDGISHLRGTITLHDLSLRETAVGNTGLMHLKGLVNLSYLDVSGTHVTAGGIAELQQVLPQCSIVWECPPKSQQDRNGDGSKIVRHGL